MRIMRGDPSYKERRAAAPLFEFQMVLMLGSWTDLSYAHLKRNTGRFNGWMNLKFELGIPNTIMHRVSKLQLDPTVVERDMGLQS